MRILVVRESGLEPAAQAFAVIENGTECCAGLLFTARNHDFKRSLKENHTRFRALEQRVSNGRGFYCATTNGKDKGVLMDEFIDDFGLERAEARFSFFGKNSGYGSSRTIFKHSVSIQKSPLQLAREKGTDSRLPCAHESDKDDA
jgi:hypothetical protein